MALAQPASRDDSAPAYSFPSAASSGGSDAEDAPGTANQQGHSAREKKESRHVAARRRWRPTLTTGYLGQLVTKEVATTNGRATETVRMRASSAFVGLGLRNHLTPRLGLHSLMGVALGAGHFGAGSIIDGTGSKAVGAIASLLAETGLLLGPFGTAPPYIHFVVQGRAVVPPTHDPGVSHDQGTSNVHWDRPTWLVGARVGPGFAMGDRDQYHLELGFGGGAVVRRGGGLFADVTLRAGVAFGH